MCTRSLILRTAKNKLFSHLLSSPYVHPSSFPLLGKLIKRLSSIPFIAFAFKCFVNSHVQTYSTLVAQTSHFIVIHYATQIAYIVLYLVMGRASHLRTFMSFWAPAATTTTFSFRRSTLRALTRRLHISFKPWDSFFTCLHLILQLPILPRQLLSISPLLLPSLSRFFSKAR